MQKLLLTAVAVALCMAATFAHAAGFRYIEVPADAAGAALEGAMWSPCAASPGELDLGGVTVPGVRDCPIAGDRLPLAVVSHGAGGSYKDLQDTAETLADAGFVVVAVDHPDGRRDLVIRLVERPIDSKRLIDFVLGGSAVASRIDPQRIGFYGFSLGGYTGLVILGANPDWATARAYCQPYNLCDQLGGKQFSTEPLAHDARIRAAVLADPGPIFFYRDSFATVNAPIQLWVSEGGGPRERVDFVNQSLPAKHEYHVVPNSRFGALGGHFAFVLCPPALAEKRPEICSDRPGFDRAAFHKEFNAAVLAFFREHLPRR
jgi:predicted dienelactone hydrolase